jgi:hypothetical protein
MAIAERLGQLITREKAEEITDGIMGESAPHNEESFGAWLLRKFSYAIALAVIFVIVIMAPHFPASRPIAAAMSPKASQRPVLRRAVFTSPTPCK